MSNITIYTDENGVAREYREVKRQARVGELIKPVDAFEGVFKVSDIHGTDYVVINDTWLIPHNKYTVLVPTNIIHYNGKRYREVKREAKEGELVRYSKSICRVLSVNDTEEDLRDFIGDLFGGIMVSVNELSNEDYREISRDWIEDQGFVNIQHDKYFVLEPVADNKPIAAVIHPTPPAPSVDERIATLERRVAELERRLLIRDIANKVMDRNDGAFRKLARTEFQEYLRASEAVSDETKLTRERVIEWAKRDVEQLLSSYHESLPFVDFDATHKCEFVVNREKRTVVALIRGKYTNHVYARGKAKCAPGDCFNIWIGRALALRRALGLDVPDYYLNAPQPDISKRQQGDVVEYNGQRFVISDGRRWGVGYAHIESFAAKNGRLVDDSHDFAGQEVK
jgi:hypothetical protein